MKRFIALAALLLAASACATTTNTNEGANTNANANASPAATATPAGVTQADLEAKEHQVWDAFKAKNYDAFGALLSDDFTYVTNSGVYDKSQTIDAIKKYDLTDYSFSDIKFVKVDDDLAVLVYTCTETSTVGGKPSPESGKKVYHASAWVNRGGKWIAAYHQDTLKMEPPAGQGGNTNAGGASNANASNANASNKNANASGANANTSASPAATPAAPASATDAEKAVWDALKSKNYDAFAAFIASGAVEVEPDSGVTDKSGSIEGVKHFDASKLTQSDFKETKLDTDSTLVTYVVKGTMNGKPVNERHSTVWNNRGGKWQAYFHEGTVATK
ncbi:MAG: nuclear transport factor 2 family protein [Acidobacteriota bacterium]|nr:nuclear transport factor 2 family protein [Acidobacteriota bacterium]MDQ5835869.1 nuclear transport factor 2 family protein [Acidobacteriota bacterium]